MSSALLPALLALQVFNICGGSLLLNGAVGESIVLPTGAERSYKGGAMLWKRKSIEIIKLVKNTMTINPNFTGTLTMNDETGALNISNLREEDSGEYDFSGIASAQTIPPKNVQLQVYERIVSVQVISQVNNSTDSGSCNITLICSVNGGSQVALSWSRNGQNVAGVENRTTLTAPPTLTEEIYVCTATNPISSQSNSVTVRPCRDISNYLKYIAAGGGGLLVVAMVVITLMSVRKKSKTGEAEEDGTVYAEVGDIAQKPSVYSQSPHPGDINTCYDVIKGTGSPTAPSTVYDTVKFDRGTARQYQEVL
ncbi:hypothetical protein SKAU_G00077670 [Synaphobranchus kaupii]|uniref:Ig-like domain-containing protein n=1 Tax=Synaphobranchus kaupii TaxID=118154 RepID=A0A9Q1G944_SYNKA|nr:hypothetical protein SKAU_G00077670 [Synaphobranchus kaupii]